MNYWFAVSNDIIEDPKLALIAKKQGILKPLVLSAWIYILREASKSETRGIIERLNCDEAEFLTEIPAETLVKIINALNDRGIISYEEIRNTSNEIEFYNLAVLKFDKWQSIVSEDLQKIRDRERQRKHREHLSQKNVTVTKNCDSHDLSQKKCDSHKKSDNTIQYNTIHDPESSCPTFSVSENADEKFSPPDDNNPKRKTRYDPCDAELAEEMLNAIQALTPHIPVKANRNNWANTIRLMREADKIPIDQIRTVFLWANKDPFWSKNILSPDKLRKQFRQLTLSQSSPNSKTFRGYDSSSQNFDDMLDENGRPKGW